MMLPAVSAEDAFDIGWAAVDLMRPTIALKAFGIARQQGVPDADYAHTIALGNAGQPLPAVSRLRQLHRQPLAGIAGALREDQHAVAQGISTAYNSGVNEGRITHVKLQNA
ncbi:hypothetical protein [Streptomyces sp. Ag109_G2-15]|uniref:hypothetical protein n=1 Tax=Streptomyces sp. Ag109_G2-15 TaxID=1938850 RepID=UPI001C539F87|nr:hypothetical protein [Streptomyces sp. Ag109_G2-15]